MTASAVAARTARVPRIAAPRWLRVLLRSVLDLVLVVWLAATVAFLALRLIPGDPLDVLLSGVQDATPEMRAAIAAHYGLDQPVIVQYFAYLLGVVQGDLGTSYHRGAPSQRCCSASWERRSSSRWPPCCSPWCSRRPSRC
ncbi:ABC transporter permease family protein [Leucobacter muris]|uniref:hypothetical protein n=1 Tax=Leucobacter muris TaxID=1935379 RepID=UPI001E3DF157|nr:hypothetical protein [Leucobacter muris]